MKILKLIASKRKFNKEIIIFKETCDFWRVYMSILKQSYNEDQEEDESI
jgi:hypothetical protein